MAKTSERVRSGPLSHELAVDLWFQAGLMNRFRDRWLYEFVAASGFLLSWFANDLASLSRRYSVSTLPILKSTNISFSFSWPCYDREVMDEAVGLNR